MGDFITAWANAIAAFEGFSVAGSRPARNHNPGDLKYAGQSGAVGQDAQGFAIFPDDATGFQALYNQLAKYVSDFPGYSLLDITAHYLGQHIATSDSQGNAFQYAGFVAGQLGTDVSTTIGDLASGGVSAPADSSGDATASDTGTPNTGGLVTMLVVGGLALWAATRLFG